MNKIKIIICFLLIFIISANIISFAKEYVYTRAVFCYGDCSPPEITIAPAEEFQILSCELVYAHGFRFELVCISIT